MRAHGSGVMPFGIRLVESRATERVFRSSRQSRWDSLMEFPNGIRVRQTASFARERSISLHLAPTFEGAAEG